MATKTLNDFTTSTAAASDDFVVGFDTAVAGGERKWTVATIANAVSGVMTAQLNNAFFNTTDVIPIAKGGTGRTTGFAGLTSLAGTDAPLANTYLKVNSTKTALLYDTISLTTGSTDVTGILPIANGGTGTTTGVGGTARAWVNFDGTGTIGANQSIRSQYNVSSVTKLATGSYRVNFATAAGISNSNYAWSINGQRGESSNNALMYSAIGTGDDTYIPTVTYLPVYTSNSVNTSVDALACTVIIFA